MFVSIDTRHFPRICDSSSPVPLAVAVASTVSDRVLEVDSGLPEDQEFSPLLYPRTCQRK